MRNNPIRCRYMDAWFFPFLVLSSGLADGGKHKAVSGHKYAIKIIPELCFHVRALGGLSVEVNFGSLYAVP